MNSTSPSDPPERRFGFGRNWRRFLRKLDQGRLEQARRSLKSFWPKEPETPRFLDIGSGSGTFSLAARQLGATVHSFDYDSDSVTCARQLKQAYFSDDPNWRVERGSVLDEEYIRSLGEFDLVYSWGVLHHTGEMWTALEHAAVPVQPGGLLVIALYNDQGRKSQFWTIVKKCYCSGAIGRWLMTALFVPFFMVAFFFSDVLKGRSPLARYRSRHDARGMSVVTDIIDWIGGYPFEVARPEQIHRFYEERGFELVRETLTKGLGCNEFVFRRRTQS